MARAKGKHTGVTQITSGGPKQKSGHLFGAAGGVQGSPRANVKGQPHHSHKQHTGKPGKHT